jgi:hypothetical protein
MARTRAIAALLAVVAVSVALWLALRPSSPEPLGLVGRPAAAFADSVGVNVHTSYLDTAYARHDEIRARLRELGVRNVRDGFVPGRPDQVDELRRLAADGIRTTLIVERPDLAIPALRGPLRDTLAAIEGPNELDVRRVPDWQRALRQIMPRLRAARLGVPLLGPSLVHDDSRTAIAFLARDWDATSLHPYPGGQPPEAAMPAQLRAARAAEGKPVVATESGYHNALRSDSGQPPVSEAASAVYLPRLLLEDFRLGVRRTFLYELADEKPDPALRDPEQHFGLLRSDLEPKPAFLAVQRLLAAARGTAPGDAPAPRVRTDAAARGVRAVLLDRADGSRLLALWRPVAVWSVARREPVRPTPVNVRVTFSRAPRGATLAHPSLAAGRRRLGTGTSVSVPVGADVALLAYH